MKKKILSLFTQEELEILFDTLFEKNTALALKVVSSMEQQMKASDPETAFHYLQDKNYFKSQYDVLSKFSFFLMDVLFNENE